MVKGSGDILVIGGTGTQGRSAVRHLLQSDFPVRVLCRDTSKQAARELSEAGAELVSGDLNRPQTVRQAMKGCYGVYCVLTFAEEGIDGEVRQGRLVVDAATDADISHFIYSSVCSADEGTGIPHFDSKFEIETMIEDAGLPATIVRPVWFMENFSNWYRQNILNGQLSLPLKPTTKLQMIAVDDIGRVAADCFDKPDEYVGAKIDLAGDELTMTQTAELFSQAIGRDVDYVQMPMEDARKQSEEMASMFEWFEQVGYQVDLESLRQEFPYLQRFDQWLTSSGWRSAGRAAA